LPKSPFELRTFDNLADSDIYGHKEAIKVFIAPSPISAHLTNQCKQPLDFKRDTLDVYLELIGYELIALSEKLKQLQGQIAKSRNGRMWNGVLVEY